MSNKNYSKWKSSEVIELFTFIEKCKQKNIALTSAFKKYADLTNRKANSVRNYYYLELKELEKNEGRRKKLNIDLNKHSRQEFKEFSNEEEYDLAYFILERRRDGKSVRSSCLALSKNNINAMIRYQNKFRSLLKQKPDLIENINKKLDKIKGQQNEITTDSKILNFPKNKNVKINNGRISDDEIKSLFMGLVRLVKKSATLEVSSTLKAECNYANENLRKTLVSMSEKQKEIIKLTEKNKLLVSKVNELENKLKELRVKAVEEIKDKLGSKSKS